MTEITGQMILECYNEFKKGNRDHIPNGMNENSAKMTMVWLECLFIGKPYHRSDSTLQWKLVLEHIKKDYGNEQLLKAKYVLMEYCEWALKHNKPCISLGKVLNSF